MDLKMRMAELARIQPASTPVVSVYLNTHWADEHQRDRVRIFLKNELARARDARGPRPAEADLRWVEAEGEALLNQISSADAQGVAFFACEAAGLRQTLRSRAPFNNTFEVADTPFLRPLAELTELAPPLLVVFVDTDSARLVLIPPEGAREEVVLHGDVSGHRNPGGWEQMAQSRYQQHIEDHRARHFEAVADTLIGLAETHDTCLIVLAGNPRNVAAFRKELPARIANYIVGTVAGAHYEPTDAIAARATEYLSHVKAAREASAVDAVLTAAAKHGKATAGLEATLEAVNFGAVHRLYLLKGWSAPGRRCTGCGRLQSGFSWVCPICGREATTVELGEAMTARLLASGASVETIEMHQPLSGAGGIAAELRFPL